MYCLNSKHLPFPYTIHAKDEYACIAGKFFWCDFHFQFIYGRDGGGDEG